MGRERNTEEPFFLRRGAERGCPGVLMQEETFPGRATEDWIGLSALDYSLVLKPGARAPGWYKGGPLALKATGYQSICSEDVS